MDWIGHLSLLIFLGFTFQRYLAVSSKKAVYQEAICEDDQAAGARSKRSKDKQAGRAGWQRLLQVFFFSFSDLHFETVFFVFFSRVLG